MSRNSLRVPPPRSLCNIQYPDKQRNLLNLIGGAKPNKLMKSILEDLENIKHFPTKKPLKDKTRTYIGRVGATLQTFTLGKVRAYDKSELVNSKYNKRFPELFNKLKKLIKEKAPNYEWTSLIINKNLQSKWHKDKNNIDFSYAIGLGDFKKGGFDIRTNGDFKSIDNKNKLVKFDGHIEHRTSAGSSKGGNRYAIIYYKRN